MANDDDDGCILSCALPFILILGRAFVAATLSLASLALFLRICRRSKHGLSDLDLQQVFLLAMGVSQGAKSGLSLAVALMYKPSFDANFLPGHHFPFYAIDKTSSITMSTTYSFIVLHWVRQYLEVSCTTQSGASRLRKRINRWFSILTVLDFFTFLTLLVVDGLNNTNELAWYIISIHMLLAFSFAFFGITSYRRLKSQQFRVEMDGARLSKCCREELCKEIIAVGALCAFAFLLHSAYDISKNVISYPGESDTELRYHTYILVLLDTGDFLFSDALPACVTLSLLGRLPPEEEAKYPDYMPVNASPVVKVDSDNDGDSFSAARARRVLKKNRKRRSKRLSRDQQRSLSPSARASNVQEHDSTHEQCSSSASSGSGSGSGSSSDGGGADGSSEEDDGPAGQRRPLLGRSARPQQQQQHQQKQQLGRSPRYVERSPRPLSLSPSSSHPSPLRPQQKAGRSASHAAAAAAGGRSAPGRLPPVQERPRETWAISGARCRPGLAHMCDITSESYEHPPTPTPGD